MTTAELHDMIGRLQATIAVEEQTLADQRALLALLTSKAKPQDGPPVTARSPDREEQIDDSFWWTQTAMGAETLVMLSDQIVDQDPGKRAGIAEIAQRYGADDIGEVRPHDRDKAFLELLDLRAA